MSQAIRRPEERERDGGTADSGGSQDRHIYQLSLLSYMDAVEGTPKTITTVTSKITNSHNKYNNHEKV